MEDKSFEVVYLGESGFPIGMAAVQKMTMIGKALIQSGVRVHVINFKARFPEGKVVDVKVKGNHKGLEYIYSSGGIYQSNSFFRRNWDKLKGTIGEYRYIKSLYKKGDLKGAVISSYSFWRILLYLAYGKFFDIPIILNYVELITELKHRKRLQLKLNDYLLDRFLVKRMDAALPISELLIKHFKALAPSKNYFKIPVLCDFEPFQKAERTTEAPYFFYCGAVTYMEVIEFVLEAYENISDEHYQLVLLVSGGTKDQYQKLEERINRSSKGKQIKIYKNVPYSQLVSLYVNAKAMLIPLRDTKQDKARFPHKIGEYCASANPIISTEIGEVAHYFKDEKNGLLAKKYNSKVFSEKMQFCIDHPKEAEAIGQAGYQLGLEKFDYRNIGQDLKSFIIQLNGDTITTATTKKDLVL